MPIRVPEGPIDPYEPFPFDGPAAPAWSRAPIVKGRDAAGIDGRDVVAQAAATADEARFVDIDDVTPAPPPLDSWRFAHDILGSSGRSAEATEIQEQSGSAGGDSYSGWLLEDVAGPEAPQYAPTGLTLDDPWAVVTSSGAGDGLHAEPLPPQPIVRAAETAPEAPFAAGPIGETETVRRAGGPPMSSRAILMVGSLALLCLALAAALAFQAIGESAGDAPALEASPDEVAAPRASPARETRLSNPLLESLPVSDTTLTSIERAAMGPLELELERLGQALQAAFGRSSSEVAPVLRPYIAHAAERMRTHPARFRLVVSAPRAELASARADAILVAFEGAGLPADMLTLTAGAGAPGVTFDR